jgi:quinoprotein glucose dehydrogenase
MEDMVTAADTTEAHAKACRDLAEKSGTMVNEGPFTPWVYREAGAPPTSSVIFPGAIGGTDWGGMSSDPKAGLIFVNTSYYASIGWVEKKAVNSRVPYDQTSVFGNPVASKFWDRKVDDRGRLLGEQSWPCQKPPWGHLAAIDVSTGTLPGRVTLGITTNCLKERKIQAA